MADKRPSIQMENPILVYTALFFLLTAVLLVLIGLVGNGSADLVNEASDSEAVNEVPNEDPSVSDYFEGSFEEYEVPENYNSEYYREDPFKGVCSESGGTGGFSFGVVCIPQN